MTEGTPQFRLRTLGDLALYRPGEDSPCVRNAKALGLAAYLALTPDRRSRRPHLARLFWPDADRQHRLRSLRQALYYLTDRCGRDLFRRDNGVLALHTELLEVDLWEFDRALEAGDHERVAELYGGGFLEGFNGDVSRELHHWREAETERIWSGLKLSLRRLVEQKLDAGPVAEAIDHARRYRDLNPLDETARELLIHALVADGRDVEAYQEYEQYATLLEEELRDTPSEELEEKARRVRKPLIEERSRPPAPPAGDDRGRQGSGPARTPEGIPYAAAGATVLLLAGLVWSWWTAGNAPGSAGAFAAATADVTLVRRASPRQWTLQVRHGEPAGASPRATSPRAAPRPRRSDGAAVPLRSATGLDIGLTGAGDDADTTRLTGRPYDEHPLDFSPDGRLLLYSFGVEAREGERYDLYAGILDPETGRRRMLEPADLTRVKDGDWSPHGARVALAGAPSGGDRDVWVTTVRGNRSMNVSGHPARDGEPAWSPEADRIAFTSHRTGDADVFIVRPDGTELRQITRHPAPDHDPVWLSPNHLAFVSERGEGADLWGYFLPTGELRRITDLGDVKEVVSADLREPGRWIDSVRIRTERRRVVPGEYLDLRADVYDARDRRHSEGSTVLRWSVSDAGGVRRPDDGGLHRIRTAAGAVVELRADVGGWRSDTVRLRTTRLSPTGAEPVAAETWSDRPLETRWIPFGSPSPTLSSTPAADRRVVDPEGDEHFDSGLVRTAPIPLAGGATVTVRARADFTQPLFQAFHVELVPSIPERGVAVWNRADPIGGVKVHSGRRFVTVRRGGRSTAVPRPFDAGQWQRYTIQISPDGALWVLVDGDLLWRSPPGAVDLEEDSHAHLALYGRSDDTDVLFGPVRVFRGPRYRLE